MNTILLVVDVQTALVEEHPYNEENVIANIKHLILAARKSGTEVIFVRHNDGKDSDLEMGTRGWEIYHELSPNSMEKIFEKEYNSSFLHTGLKEYLVSKNVKNIILTGMQTEYCIDTTCRVAFEFGFNLYIPEETNTTFNNEFLSGQKLYEYYNYKIWNNRFAKMLSLEETENLLEI